MGEGLLQGWTQGLGLFYANAKAAAVLSRRPVGSKLRLFCVVLGVHKFFQFFDDLRKQIFRSTTE